MELATERPEKVSCCAWCLGWMLPSKIAVHIPHEQLDQVDKLVKTGEVGTDDHGEMSLVQRAGDAAKRFIDAVVAAMSSPRDDIGLDAREMLTPVGTHLDRVSASLKLESMTRPSIVLVVALFYFAAIFALVLAIILIVLEKEKAVGLAEAEASFALEGISRTIAVALTLFMLIFFTFRIVRYTMKTKQPILPEQSLLILFLLLIMGTPGFSVYSPYVFWNQYQTALELTARNTSLNSNSNLTDGERFAFFFFSSSSTVNKAKTVTSVFTGINLAFGVVYFGLTIFFFGKPQKHWTKKKEKKDIEVGGQCEKYQTLEECLWEKDNDDEPDDEHWLSSRQMVMNCMSTYRELAVTANRPVILLALAYLILVLVLVLVYDYLPSQVPFIGMISVLKVCPISSGKGQWAGKMNCDPSVLGGLPFARAMSITGQFIAEFVVTVYLHYITVQTKLHLKKMPYEWNRAKHLGFRYFNSNKRVTFAFIIVMSIIGCAAGDGLADIYQVEYSSVTNTVTIIYSPLKQVGINFFNLGFGPFYLLFSCFLFALAVAYLPPDSAPGIRGFCCGGSAIVTECDLDLPAYILRESDVLLLRKCRDDARKKLRHHRRITQVNASSQGPSPGSPSTPNHEFEGQPADEEACSVTNGGQGEDEVVKNDDGRGARKPAIEEISGRPDLRQNSEPLRDRGIGTDTLLGAAHSTQPDSLNVERAKSDQDEENRNGTNLDSHTSPPFRNYPPPPPMTDVFAQQYDKLAALLRPKLQPEKSKSLFRLMDSGSLGIISEQMNSNVFCMETEILLLNFAFLAYSFGSVKDQKPLTAKEKQAMLGKESRYRLVSHLENPRTDIQCCVFVDDESEKIFVAFRGTSTRKNVWEDIDTIAVRHPQSEGVEPLIRSTDDAFSRRAAVEKPRVHRGFFHAYLSIKEDVVKVVSDIIDSRERGCVLFSCGHSLGGALATHFGMDIGMKYPVLESNLKGLQVTTFGSPRVGTFSYVSRHRRVVPTTHRFCIGGDPVPKLPPSQWFSDYTKWGFHHVGVEILLDIERFNLLVGPLFIERQIQDAWGGYIPKNHITSSYVLVLALWCAQVHPTFSPDWWLPVVNHLLKKEMTRLNRIMDLKKELMPAVMDQLSKEGAMWIDGKRALRNCGCDSSSAIDQRSSTDEEAARVDRDTVKDDEFSNKPRGLVSLHALSDMVGVDPIETVLAECGLDKLRTRAEVLVECGFTSPAKLQRLQLSDFERLNKVARSKKLGGKGLLFDDECVKLLMGSLSGNRCLGCSTPLFCPRCADGKVDVRTG